MPIISGKALGMLEDRLRSLLDDASLRRRGGNPIPTFILDWEPTDDRIHVAREPLPTIIGGMVLPDEARDNYPQTIGWVVATGPGATVELGTKVMIGQYSGGPIDYQILGSGKLYFGDFVSMHEGDILAIHTNDHMYDNE